MQLGMIGLGRMGANMVRRLMAAGIECVVFDVDPAAVERLESEGATGCKTLDEMSAELDVPRNIWLMVPAGLVDDTLSKLVTQLTPGDTVIDGGNSYYRDDIDRHERLAGQNLNYVDCGTSGGVWGLERGYCLMIGGDPEPVGRLQPVFEALAPGADAAPRTPGRKDEPSQAERGYLHCGPSGAGHFVKMVHNGIEYGLMAAYAEGLNVLKHADAGLREREVDAETTPLREPRYYGYELDIGSISELWRRGSVIASWLLDLTAQAFAADDDWSRFEGRVSDSGEGRWTAIAAIDEAVPTPVLTSALQERFSSRGEAEFANRVLSAMRYGFGGHLEQHTEQDS
jgi:6-phosphogluconate dehydrogenase